MSDEVEKYDEFGDLSLPEGKDDTSNLDEYGVWIKKKPSADTEIAQAGLSSSEEEEEHTMEEEKEIPFDFDGLDENDSSYEDSFEKELKETEDSFDESSSDPNFNDVDMSNFFTDLGNDEENEENTKKEDEEALKMDLNFDTVDSYMNEENKDDFDDILDDADSSTDSELDDFLSDLNSSSSKESKDLSNNKEETNHQDIELNIEVDENQDFSDIDQTTEAEESVILPPPISESNKNNDEEKEETPIVIKNTVVEPENREETHEENKIGIEESSEKAEHGFNDIEALANELTSDISNVTNNFSMKENGPISVEGLDKITELLTEIVQELSSMKNEITALKAHTSFTTESCTSPKKKDVEEDAEASGFFKDEDTDEAIALTGDELNNILITADFTEEDDPNEKPNDDITFDDDIGTGTCEACTDDEVEDKSEDDFSSDKDVDFDDITLENSKLDDFVIPEELDYSMLSNNEGSDIATDDMSYLDEKEDEDEVSIDIPETQDISVEESNEENEPINDKSSDSEALPNDIKQEVKSVLAYMDQLLESLPEDKIKEFAESEYYEMYHRLFSELGIS
ncbi:MAG: hypothetical protein ACTTKH_02810 [Treponema sp.]